MRHRLFAHIVWTTLGRAPIIDRRAEEFLREQFPIIIGQERGNVLAIGIVATHVHLLIRLHPRTSIPLLVQRLKGTTSHSLRNTATRDGAKLRWAKGYSIQSVGEQGLVAAAHYVESQAEHHPADVVT